MDANNVIIPGFDADKDDSLQIRLDKSFNVPNGLIIYLTGYIDTYNSTYFQKKITQVIEAGFVNLIFNCAALNYVSSTGIGSFTVFLKSSQRFTKYSSCLDSLSSSILRTLQKKQSTSSLKEARQPLLSSHLLLNALYAAKSLEQQKQVVSAVQDVNQFWQSTNAVKFHLAKQNYD